LSSVFDRISYPLEFSIVNILFLFLLASVVYKHTSKYSH